MIPAKAAVKAIDYERGDSILVGTMTPNRDLATISTNPDMDLPIFGAMGKASSVGLGLALARHFDEAFEGLELFFGFHPHTSRSPRRRFPDRKGADHPPILSSGSERADERV